MLTYQIFKGDKPVKIIGAKGMNSIYTQYNKYCARQHGTTMIECSQAESVGLIYWTNRTDNFYLKYQ